MKVMHIINLILIAVVLIGICIAEELTVSNSLKDIQDRCLSLERKVEEDQSLKTSNIVLAVDNLEDYWINAEMKLSFMVNHKNIQEMGQEIAKIKMYIYDDDIPAFKVSLETIKMYCHSYLHFMGANLHNVL